MSWTFEPEESERVNKRILAWLRRPHDRGDSQEAAVELGLSRNAFYQRVCRLRKKEQTNVAKSH